MSKVKVWKEIIIIPTYETGEPEKNPVFLENRVYQGSSGVVYPYPVIEKISDKKTDKQWQALFLENDFIKIMILPGLGGRVQMAYDKTKQRHFVYYNRVIKPALVGLTGPWISGGIEFNWPQHHRPTTFDPVDFMIEENEDGSATVWCSELERMFRTKGMTGFTVYPDKSYLEIKVKLYNKTSLPQTFLWWANPAVHVNEHYQSVFPPDVNAVFDHGKRDVSSFPIATGTYYKVDYSPGTDISGYKNIPVPTSYMAHESKYDFLGGYENDTKGGVIHVANHYVSPGKKQWTWGNSEFGHTWDRNLTDEDGPYIELMCGVYTDNQPDFSWMAPNEEKEFVQYFMPYRDLGRVKNSTRDAMLNVEVNDREVTLKIYTTGIYPGCRVELLADRTIIFADSYDASPLISYEKSVRFSEKYAENDLYISVKDREGKELVGWQPERPGENKMPEPAKPAKAPEEISGNEQLYFTGLHLEQYRHATFNPVDYYREALRRDKGDVRNNNAMGLWLLRRAKFSEAEKHFRKAIERLTQRNPNPVDGEPFFNLGLSLKYQGKNDDAYGAFYKSVWNAAWQNPGYFHLAQIDCLRNNSESALDHIARSISGNTSDHKARHLKTIILRKLGQTDAAIKFIEESLALDHFNYGILYEKYLITGLNEDSGHLQKLIRNNIHNYIEYSLDYAAAGFFEEAIGFLTMGIEESGSQYPVAWYYLTWYYYLGGERDKASELVLQASKKSPDYCFPNQVESLIALKLAADLDPKDARTFYYMGNFWYNFRQYSDALECWERSASLDGSFPTVFRNLALCYFNKKQAPDKALTALENAFSLDPSDPRILLELDQLYKRLNHDPGNRLQFLEKNLHLVQQRDDLYLERITLYNIAGNHQKAYDLIMQRKFHPWEGGEGKVSGQYLFSLVAIARNEYYKGSYEKAIDFLEKALHYPENLGEGKLYGAQENDIYYWLGCSFSKMNENARAREYWLKASTGLSEPDAAVFYNDQPPDKIFYQGLSLIRLNEGDKANERFNRLIQYGKAHIDDDIKIDYFAVSLPDMLIWEDDLNKRNRIHCKYMIGLGKLGLGLEKEAAEEFNSILNLEKTHQGAILHMKTRR